MECSTVTKKLYKISKMYTKNPLKYKFVRNKLSSIIKILLCLEQTNLKVLSNMNIFQLKLISIFELNKNLLCRVQFNILNVFQMKVEFYNLIRSIGVAIFFLEKKNYRQPLFESLIYELLVIFLQNAKISIKF